MRTNSLEKYAKSGRCQSHIVRLLAAFLIALVAMQAPAHAEVIDIDNQKLAQLREEGVPVIDIRRLDEWQETGIIEGSLLMTFFDAQGRQDAEKWFKQFSAKVDPEKPVVLICRSGARSEAVSNWLSKYMNLPSVYNVDEGILNWKANGGEIVAVPEQGTGK